MTTVLPPVRRIGADRARRMLLTAQGFADPRPTAGVNRRHLARALTRLKLLQIDSVNVLARAHYLPLYSRLGPYPMSLLDEAAFIGPVRRRVLVEQWAHEASLVPPQTWPLFRWRMDDAQSTAWGGMKRLNAERPGYVQWVAETVAEKGPVRAGEVEARTDRAGPWWDWHEAKVALEFLFRTGRITVARRTPGFERVYDLTERVLPAEVVDQHPPREQAQDKLVRQAASALGVATTKDLSDYWRMSVAHTTAAVDRLVAVGELEPVDVVDWPRRAYLSPDARAPRRVTGAALLAPFDPLVWDRARALRVFGFHYRIEIYTPAAQRVHGYYVLPFLLDGQLVARVDLKADRSAGVLRVQSAHAEPGQEPARVARALAEQLHLTATWLGLDEVVVAGRGDLAGPLRSLL